MVFTETMPIGEKLINSLAITILGMAVVFSVLIIIAYSLGLLRILFQEKKKHEVLNPEKVVETKAEPVQNRVHEAQENIEDIDLLLLITAAIAAESGASSNDFFVKSINQMPQKSNIWASTGRQENMSKLSK